MMDGATPREWIEQGQQARARGDRAAAAAAFRAALALQPGHAWARLELALELAALGEFAAAEALCRAVLAEAPGEAAAPLRLGEVLRQRGDAAGALAALQAAVAAEPRHVWARLELAQELARQSREAEAEPLLRGIIADAPHLVVAHLRLGEGLRRRGDRAGALAAFEAAVVADPAHAWARLECAQELLLAGHLGAAERQCRAVLDQAPGQVAAHLRLAEIARRRGDRPALLAALQAAQAADPAHLQVRLALALELAEQGRAAEARPLLAAVLAAEPAHATAWARLGLVERLAGDRVAALAGFRRALDAGAGEAQLLVEIAVEERALGRAAESEASLRRALERDPRQAQALAQLAEHLLLAERPEEAVAPARGAVAAQPDLGHAHHVLARALAATAGPEEAIRSLDAAEAGLGPRPELSALRLGLLRQAGRPEAARALLDGASPELRRHPSFWLPAVEFDIESGHLDRAAAALADPPPGTVRDTAAAHVARARLAEAEWRLAPAIGEYRAALRLHPDAAAPHQELARLSLLTLDVEAAAAHLRDWVRLTATARWLRGQKLSTSQTHPGQLLDEFLLDREMLEALTALRDQPPEARIGPLLGLVRRSPDYTPAALCLMVALREAGLLPSGAGGAAAGPSGLPRRIAQYWSDPDPPAALRPLLRSWPERHPGHEYRRFDDDSAAAFLAGRLPPAVLRAFRRASLPAQRADLFRLAWLLLEGGLWADADDLCHGPPATLLPPGTRFAAGLEPFGTLGNNLLLAMPGDPVIGRALELAVAALNRGDKDIPWLSTGPGLLTRAFAGVMAESGETPAAWLRGRAVLPREVLARCVSMNMPLEYKRADRAAPRGASARAGLRVTLQPGAARPPA